MRFEMIIQGMASVHCQSGVLCAIREVSGVLAAEVNLERGTAWIDTLEGVSPDSLRDAVEDWGYQVIRIDKKNRKVLPD